MSCGKDWEILQREYVYLFSAEANLKIVMYAIIKSNPKIKPNLDCHVLRKVITL